jgi:hypothetical protein
MTEEDAGIDSDGDGPAQCAPARVKARLRTSLYHKVNCFLRTSPLLILKLLPSFCH